MGTMRRRDFLAGAAALGTLGTVTVQSTQASANEKVAVAVIGLGSMGLFHVRTLVDRSDAVVACLCDVDERALDKAEQIVKVATRQPPKQVGEYETILEDPAIDAVLIATPHHWHCPIALRALKAKKDVYLEKPASHVFQEGRLLIEATQSSHSTGPSRCVTMRRSSASSRRHET